MHLSLDTATLTFFAAILSMCMATLVFNTAREVRSRGLEQWGLAMTCASLAFALYFLRGTAPIFLTYVMANGLMLAVTMLGVVAYARVLDVAVPWLAVGPGSVIALSGVLSVSMIGAPNQLGVLFMNVVLATHVVVAIQLIVQSSQRQGLRTIWASVTALSALSLTLVARGAWSTVTDARSLEVSVNALPQVAAFMAGMLVVVVSTIDLVSMANERVSRDTMTKLRRDGLTGLLTRTALIEMSDEVNKFGRSNEYAVLMLDIDNFKTVNDTYGHSGGDVVLAYVARLIARSIRTSDIAARYGGEEFCVLLRNCTAQQARTFAERIVGEVRRQVVRLTNGREVHVTISIGYAHRELRPIGQEATKTFEATIECADQALYFAKNAGRNQAVAAKEPVLSSTTK